MRARCIRERVGRLQHAGVGRPAGADEQERAVAEARGPAQRRGQLPLLLDRRAELLNLIAIRIGAVFGLREQPGLSSGRQQPDDTSAC